MQHREIVIEEEVTHHVEAGANDWAETQQDEHESTDAEQAADNELTPEETDRLAVCEQVIDQHKDAAAEVVKALDEIKKDKLYRAEFKNFDEYCRVRWQWCGNYANRQIKFAQVVEVLKSVPTGTVFIPGSEWLARPFAKLKEPDQILEAGARVKQQHGDEANLDQIEATVTAMAETDPIANPTKAKTKAKPKEKAIKPKQKTSPARATITDPDRTDGSNGPNETDPLPDETRVPESWKGMFELIDEAINELEPGQTKIKAKLEKAMDIGSALMSQANRKENQ